MDALHKAGCQEIFQEKASGSSRRGRAELARCLAIMGKGDTLVVYKIDRIARSLSDLLDILSHLDGVGATIKSITEPLDTTHSMGVFVIQILGAVAQLERSIIRERSIAGQAAARDRGRHPGRARALTPAEESLVRHEYLSGETTYRELSIKFNVSPSVIKRSVYRSTKPLEYLKKARA